MKYGPLCRQDVFSKEILCVVGFSQIVACRILSDNDAACIALLGIAGCRAEDAAYRHIGEATLFAVFAIDGEYVVDIVFFCPFYRLEGDPDGVVVYPLCGESCCITPVRAVLLVRHY